MPTSAMAHIQKTAPGPPAVMATATPAILPPPTRPPTETNSAARALILLGSASVSLRRTRNMRLKKRNCTKPLAIVKNTPRTTRKGISAQPQVRSLIALKIVSRKPIRLSLLAVAALSASGRPLGVACPVPASNLWPDTASNCHSLGGNLRDRQGIADFLTAPWENDRTGGPPAQQLRNWSGAGCVCALSPLRVSRPPGRPPPSSR